MMGKFKPAITAYYLTKLTPLIIGVIFVGYSQKATSKTIIAGIKNTISNHIPYKRTADVYDLKTCDYQAEKNRTKAENKS